VQQFLKKLLRHTERKISLHGGSILGTIRSTCLYWDSDSTGELSVPQFERVLAALQVQVSREVQQEIFAFYTGQHGLKYDTMIADAKAFEPTLVQHGEFKPSEKASSTSRDISSSSGRRLPEDVAWFVKAVKEVVNRKMVSEGGSEFSIVRAAFVANGNDFRRAMRSLGVKMTAEQVIHFNTRPLKFTACKMNDESRAHIDDLLTPVRPNHGVLRPARSHAAASVVQTTAGGYHRRRVAFLAAS
jgi:hypothetical protein